MADIETGTIRDTDGRGSLSSTEKGDSHSPPTISATGTLFGVPIIFSETSGDSKDNQAQIPSRSLGILHRLVIIQSVEQPKKYERNVKWFITFLVAGVAVIDALSSFTFWRMTLDAFLLKFINRSYSCSSRALY